jgi:hypothetical protein
MRHIRFTRKPAMIIALAAFAAGCATQQGGSAPQQGGSAPADTLSGDCNPLITGGIGAAIGALAGGSKNRGTGAAAGAAIGALACVAYNYYAKQTKTAQQVTDEYKAKNKGTLPASATVTRFNVQVAPTAKVQAGNAVNVASNIEVVPGTSNPKPNVEQEITLFSPDGAQAGKARKPASVAGAGGGGFETSFKFSLPQGVPQGVYPVKSQLYVDGKPAAGTDTRFQVVVAPDASSQLALVR